MDIKVRLFATLREGRFKEQIIAYGESVTPQMVIDQLHIALEDVAILLINGRDGKLETQLCDGDVVSIFPPVGGG